MSNMPNFDFDMFEEASNRARCVEVNLPVVLAHEEAQVVVDNTTCLPELAKKVDHIDVYVKDLEADPVFIHRDESDWAVSFSKRFPHHCCARPGRAFVKKVLVHGVLHKQIYYVNQNDDVRHHGEDIPFTKTVDLEEPVPVIDVDEVYVTFRKTKVDLTWDLVRASRLQQTGIIIVRVKVVEERRIFIQTCPPVFGKCPKGNMLRDPGLEQWVGNVPVVWGGSNIAPSDQGRTGTGALLGVDPTLQATIFQTVQRITPHNSYRLCFWTRLAPGTTPPCDNLNLTAHVWFFDPDGVILSSIITTIPGTALNNTYRKYCAEVVAAPDDTDYAQVYVTFRPEAGNTCQVVVDEVSFECIVSR